MLQAGWPVTAWSLFTASPLEPEVESDINVSFYCAVKTTSKHLSIRTCHGERFYIKHGGAEGLHYEC